MSRLSLKPGCDFFVIIFILQAVSFVSYPQASVAMDTYISPVKPDTTINEKLILGDNRSGKQFYPNIESIFLLERLRSSPVAVFGNSGRDEYLLAYAYEGTAKNAFSLFEIGYVSDLDSVAVKAMVTTHERSFKTESGLTLGLTLKEIVNIKGEEYETTTSENEKTVTYRISSLNNSPFLQRHHMPGYFIQLSLKNDRVVKIIFGFEYP